MLSKINYFKSNHLKKFIKTNFKTFSSKFNFIWLDNNQKLPFTLKLNNGTEIPRIGLGTYAIDTIEDIVFQSIKDGVRHIDTASVYENEDKVGRAINKAIKEGIVKREDLFIVTKLWINNKHKDVDQVIQKQLKDLGLDYVDLYLDHWPYSIYKDEKGQLKSVGIQKNWSNLESLVKKGYTKSIGVSNYNVQLIMDLLTYANIKPVMNQIELHPYLLQKNLREFCHNNQINITAYNSICKGKYTSYHKNTNLDLLNEPIIKDLAEKYKVGPGHIALNWALVQDIVVIPSTANPKRMKENLKALDFKLTKEDVEKINKLDMNYRFNPPQQHEFGLGIDIFA